MVKLIVVPVVPLALSEAIKWGSKGRCDSGISPRVLRDDVDPGTSGGRIAAYFQISWASRPAR
jgi:hypothetical protein